MICLAANGSPILKRLLESEPLPLQAIKCPLSANSREEVTAFRAYRPVLLHGWGPGYWIGQREIPQPDLLGELMALSGSPYLSTHLDAVPDDFDEPLTPEGVIARSRRSAEALCRITGARVLLENIPSYARSRSPDCITDPAFISEAIAVCKTGFLLDLAHARVSAGYRGMPFEQYLDALPLACVEEVHLSRPRTDHGVLRDRHLALEEDDYALLESLLPRLPRLQTVALEYGGLPEVDSSGQTIGRNDIAALRRQILRLHEILERFDAAGR